jgi:crossover junction endodeoxyribonuclease RuvC
MGISPSDFERMRARLRGGKEVPRSQRSGVPDGQAVVSKHQTILGIDPSVRATGYGIIRLEKPRTAVLAFGTISCPASWERSRCLLRITETLREQIKAHQPSACAVEGLFYVQNLKTAIIMGEARGASLVAAAEGGLEVFEIAARKVKLAIVGYGGAQKLAVAKMVQRMLELPEPPAPDAADALALALAFAHETGRFSLASPKKL